MGKIILNNIEYGTGTPNSSNVDTTNLVKKDSIVTVIDENVTDEQIPSAKAVHTVIQNVSGGVSTEQLEEAIEESKTDLEEEFHTAMGKKMDVITSYLNSPSGDLLDTTVAPLVLCALSATNNAGLYKIMNDTFAYVITNFYMSMTPTSKRFQLAIGYTKDKMAFRRYTTEWSAWTEIASTTKLQSEINSFKTDVSTTYYTKTIMDDKFSKFKDDVAMTYATQSEVNELAMDIGDNVKPAIATNTTNITNLTNKLTDYPTLEYMEEVKTDLENEIANIPKVTKTSELTNDSGFITANDIPEVDIPEVDLEPYALKTQIPTTLPASDVYAWAKASTKPTYTASEVGALASNGTAVNASKVANALTISLNGTSQGAYNGSAVKNINITPASIGALPNVGAGGVNELGQYLDLHKGGSSADYDARIHVNASNQIVHADANGTLAVNYEINNLKNTVVSGKTSVANAINGKLGTTLSNQTSFADMAYYIDTIPSMASVGSLPNSSEFIQINLPVTREVLGGKTLAKGKTVTIDGGLIMFVCDDDRESLRITPINAPIKVYGRADTTKTVNAGTSFSTDGYEWFIVNPSRTQLSCTRVGLSDADKWNPAINISIS